MGGLGGSLQVGSWPGRRSARLHPRADPWPMAGSLVAASWRSAARCKDSQPPSDSNIGSPSAQQFRKGRLWSTLVAMCWNEQFPDAEVAHKSTREAEPRISGSLAHPCRATSQWRCGRMQPGLRPQPGTPAGKLGHGAEPCPAKVERNRCGVF